jgi:RND family efflux transporter MFP subunit
MRIRAPSHPSTRGALSAPAWGIAAILALLSAGCDPSTGATKSGAPSDRSAQAHRSAQAGPVGPPRDVTTAVVVEAPWERTVRTTGELAAYDEATISVKVPGRIDKLDVDVGSRVKRGDVLALIDPRDYELRKQAAVAALQAARARLGLPLEGDDDTVVPEEAAIVKMARAQLDDMVRTRDRLLEVSESGAVSQAEQDTAGANVLMAEARVRDALEEVQNRRAMIAQRRAELAIAQQQLADTRIVAPFDGVVRERRASLGDFVAAGAPLVTFVRVDPLRLRMEVPELVAALVEKGQTVRAWLTGEERALTGTVTRTSPSITAANRSLLLEAEIPNPAFDLRPGTFARVEILVDASAKALTAPLDAVASFAGIDKAFVVADGKAVETRITTGRRDEERVEILSGLEAGDVVVRRPGNLQTGAPVRPVSAK